MRSAPFLVLAMTATALLLGGCARQTLPPATPPPPAPPPFDRAAEVAAAAIALDHGDVAAARGHVDALLGHDPVDPAGIALRDDLDADPHALLGPKSFAYTLNPGETLDDLATRFLGDPLKGYALARYNGIAVPADARPGMTLRIPGIAPALPRPRAPKPAPRKPVSAAATQPGDAARLRRNALAALAHGHRDEAVALLRRAAAADPADPLVRRDLARIAGAAR